MRMVVRATITLLAMVVMMLVATPKAWAQG